MSQTSNRDESFGGTDYNYFTNYISDNNNVDIPVYPIEFESIEELDHRSDFLLIRLLDFFDQFLVKLCDKLAGWITNLEIRMINKRELKRKSIIPGGKTKT